MPEKTGHEALILDLEALLNQAKVFQFHDFKSSAHATPKMALVERLNDLATNVKDGKYDDEYDGEPLL